MTLINNLCLIGVIGLRVGSAGGGSTENMRFYYLWLMVIIEMNIVMNMIQML